MGKAKITLHTHIPTLTHTIYIYSHEYSINQLLLSVDVWVFPRYSFLPQSKTQACWANQQLQNRNGSKGCECAQLLVLHVSVLANTGGMAEPSLNKRQQAQKLHEWLFIKMVHYQVIYGQKRIFYTWSNMYQWKLESILCSTILNKSQIGLSLACALQCGGKTQPQT